MLSKGDHIQKVKVELMYAGISLYCATATTCIMLTYIGQHHNDNPIKTQ